MTLGRDGCSCLSWATKEQGGPPGTPAELAPVAMLEELKETPTRRTSKRRANSLDEHSLDRAQRLTAMRNLDVPKDSFQGHTLGKDVGDTLQGGGSGHHLSSVSGLGINRYGDLCEAWVKV